MVPTEIEDHNFPVNGSELEVRVVDIIQMFTSTNKPTNINKDQRFKFLEIYHRDLSRGKNLENIFFSDSHRIAGAYVSQSPPLLQLARTRLKNI